MKKMWPQVEEYNFRQPREEPQTLTKMQEQRRKDKAGLLKGAPLGADSV